MISLKNVSDSVRFDQDYLYLILGSITFQKLTDYSLLLKILI